MIIAKGGYAITTILNNIYEPVTVDLFTPINVEKFLNKDIQEINLNNFDCSPKTKKLTNLKYHLNSEEKSKILKRSKKY